MAKIMINFGPYFTLDDDDTPDGGCDLCGRVVPGWQVFQDRQTGLIFNVCNICRFDNGPHHIYPWFLSRKHHEPMAQATNPERQMLVQAGVVLYHLEKEIDRRSTKRPQRRQRPTFHTA